MSEKEVMFVGDKRLGIHLLDAEQQIAIVHVLLHLDSRSPVGVVGVGAGVARLCHERVVGVTFPQRRHLRRSQRNTVVNGGLRLSYQSDFHYFQ